MNLKKVGKKKFKKMEKQASKDLSKILNPEDAYKRRQKKILKSIFGD